MVAVPALYLLAGGGSSRHGFELQAVAPMTTPAPAPASTWLAPDRIVTETPTTTLAPTTTAPPTTVAAKSYDSALAAPTTTPTTAAAPVTVATTTPPRTDPPTTTATTAPQATTTTTTTTPPTAAPALSTSAAKPTKTERGEATWFNAPDGSCAHRTAPIGTIIKVTRISTNVSTTCYVDQWGPEPPRLIDLSMDTFEKLAPAEVGVINVVIEY
ncbi:MAG: septal ring lytic transglycosylase RlpA family protein [Acidimicrobiales bacterium]